MKNSLIFDPYFQCHIAYKHAKATPITSTQYNLITQLEPIHLHPVSPKHVPPIFPISVNGLT